MIPSSENFTTQETLLSPETLDIISSLGNHEAKLLTLLFLYQATGYVTKEEMGLDFRKFIGPAKHHFSMQAPFRYCMDSLEPIGQVTKGLVENTLGQRTAYAVSEKGEEIGIPLAGLLLQWSLDNPDISLQHILGPTSTPGKIRAPHSRLQLLLNVLTSSHEGVSLSEMINIGEATGSVDLDTLDSAAEALGRANIITLERVTQKNTRLFHIMSAEYATNNGGKVVNRSSLNETVYAFMRHRVASGEETFTYDECLNYVLTEVQSVQPDVDPADVRTALTNMLAEVGSKNRSGSIFSGLENLGTFNEGKHTKIFLNEAHRTAIESLADIVLNVETHDPTTILRGRTLALKLLDTPDLRSALLNKAYNASPKTRPLTRALVTKHILQILQEATEPLHTQPIHSEVTKLLPKELSPDTIYIILKGLVDSGDVLMNKGRRDPTIKRQSNFYSIAKPPK